MIGWVLILSLGYNNATSISGIESERECQLLAERLKKEWTTMIPPPMQCFPYRAAYRF